MELLQLLRDDDAVSPVIGVILMVAITVILAAVIGAFVLGIGGDQEQTPQATWSASEELGDFNNEQIIHNVTLTHESGSQIEASNLEAAIPSQPNAEYAGGESLTAGSEVVVSVNDTSTIGDTGVDTGSAGEDLLLIWSPEGSTDTSTINTHTFTTEYVSEEPSMVVN